MGVAGLNTWINQDLQTNDPQKFVSPTAGTAGKNAQLAFEARSTLVNIPVIVRNEELINYVMRISEKLPAFNYLPRGKEIIHRLILKAATTKTIDELRLVKTEESVLESIIF